MANEKNLEKGKIKKGDLSKDEARRRGKKGGIKSGEVRRQKKTFKEIIEYCLNLDTPQEIKNKLKTTFPQIKDEDLTLQFAFVLSMINMGFKNVNNIIPLFNALRDTIGEKPIEKQETKHSGNITVCDLSKVSDETLLEMAKKAGLDLEENLDE